MKKYNLLDWIKKVSLAILSCTGIYLYCLVMLLIFNFITYRYISLNIMQIIITAAILTLLLGILYGTVRYQKKKPNQ